MPAVARIDDKVTSGSIVVKLVDGSISAPVVVTGTIKTGSSDSTAGSKGIARKGDTGTGDVSVPVVHPITGVTTQVPLKFEILQGSAGFTVNSKPVARAGDRVLFSIDTNSFPAGVGGSVSPDSIGTITSGLSSHTDGSQQTVVPTTTTSTTTTSTTTTTTTQAP